MSASRHRGMPQDAAAPELVVPVLFEQAGFFAVDLGGLRDGGQMQQFGSPPAGHNLVRLP